MIKTILVPATGSDLDIAVFQIGADGGARIHSASRSPACLTPLAFAPSSSCVPKP